MSYSIVNVKRSLKAIVSTVIHKPELRQEVVDLMKEALEFLEVHIKEYI